jgi:hypothetical protein
MAEEEKTEDKDKEGKTVTGDKDEIHVISGASGGGGIGGTIEDDSKKK